MIVVVGDSLLARQVAEASDDPRSSHVLLETQSYRTVVECIADLKPVSLVGALMTDLDVERVEKDPTPSLSRAITSTQLAIAAHGAGIPYFHLSSNLVFSGKGPHKWSDLPNPTQALGMAHLWAERSVLALGNHVTIVRLGWLFGPERTDSYPYRVVTETYEEKVKGKIARHTVHVPETFLGTPTLDEDAAYLITLHANEPGPARHVVHLGPSEDPISWYEFCGLVGTPGHITQRWDPATMYMPVNQGLVATPGWGTGTYYRAAARFLRAMKDDDGLRTGT